MKKPGSKAGLFYAIQERKTVSSSVAISIGPPARGAGAGIGRSWMPVRYALYALFDGRGDRFRRHLSSVDLLGMMETTAER
jgi:hypothetical protein